MFTDAAPEMASAAPPRRKATDPKAVPSLYSLQRVVDFVCRRGDSDPSTGPYRRVALQFPDELLPDTVLVVHKLRELLGELAKDVQLFVLADTTFASCCPDEITSEHYQADAIVHFGYACLSKSTRLPVFYVHQHRPLDVVCVRDAVADMIAKAVGATCALEEPMAIEIILFFSASVGHCIEALKAALEDASTLAGAPSTMSVLIASIAGLERWHQPQRAWVAHNLGDATPWSINGVVFPYADPSSNVLQRILCLGPHDEPHVAQLCLWGQHQRTVARPEPMLSVMDVLDSEPPVGASAPSPSLALLGDGGASHLLNRTIQQRLRQRMFNIEAIKGANAIGILVASLAIEGFRSTAEALKRCIRACSTESQPRRAYILFVGHLNQYKVANFADSIDCFVAIACPNSKECHFPTKEDGYLKPVASPAELLIALGALPFDHPYAFTTNFRVLQAIAESHIVRVELSKKGDGSNSLARNNDDDVCASSALVRPIGGGALTTSTASSSAIQRLYERSYVGLEARIGETAVQQTIEIGKSGIARGYTTEHAANNDDGPLNIPGAH